MVRLMRARPFKRLQRALDQRRLRQLAHADIGDLGGRHPQRHLVLHEIDHEQLKLGARDLLVLDRQDLADAVGGIDHEFVGLEALALGQDLLRFLDLGRDATGFAAGLCATGFATGFAAAFGAVFAVQAFGAVLGAAFEAVAFEPAAFAEVFAVLLGIALLLFFEDLPAEALAAVLGRLLREVLARLLVAPRLAADAFFELLETLFLRVF